MGQVICHSWLQKQVGVRYPSLDHTASLSRYTPFGHQCITVTISFCFCFNLQRETLISSPHRRDGDLPFVISRANRTNGFPRSLTFIDIFFDLHLCPLFFFRPPPLSANCSCLRGSFRALVQNLNPALSFCGWSIPFDRSGLIDPALFRLIADHGGFIDPTLFSTGA